MSPSFLLRARWQMWCSTSTSVIVRSGQPAPAMQRTAQRENAFHATIRPNSNSESSTLRGETRCDDETMPRAGFLAGPAFLCATTAAGFAGLADILVFAETLKTY